MLALASHAVRDKPRLRRRLLLLGIFGTALFYGDGVITPAISVLSAVEGLEVAAPALRALRRADHAGRADRRCSLVQQHGTGRHRAASSAR